MRINICMDNISLADKDYYGVTEDDVYDSIYFAALGKSMYKIMDLYENKEINSKKKMKELFDKVRYAAEQYVSYVNKDKSSKIYTYISDIRATSISKTRNIRIDTYPEKPDEYTILELVDKTRRIYDDHVYRYGNDDDLIDELLIILSIAFWLKQDSAISVCQFYKASDDIEFY